jgi:hypothetical protein
MRIKQVIVGSGLLLCLAHEALAGDTYVLAVVEMDDGDDDHRRD